MLKIIFMGTPDFAVGALDTIYKSEHQILTVITAPDKPSGRGQRISSSPVKKYAEAKGLPILQPTNLKDDSFIKEIENLAPDLIVVVAFRMLPEKLWKLPKFGTINLHASLLPDYRGAAPINWAIINGETKTGLTTFFINEIIDSGNIILQKEIEILDNDNFETLHNKLIDLGENVILDTLSIIEKNKIHAKEQIFDKEKNKPAPKLNKENTRINWNSKACDIHNLVRGLSPIPGAWTKIIINDLEHVLKIFKTNYQNDKITHETVGKIIIKDKKTISIVCKDGTLNILKLQLSGRKIMTSDEFLRGYSNILKDNFLK